MIITTTLSCLHQLGNCCKICNSRLLNMFNKIVSFCRERFITKLLDIHVFQDSEYKIGNAILELGRLDTLVLTLSKNQAVKDLQQIPDNRGSTLYRLLTDPDNVNLEYLSADLFAVSTLACSHV